MKLRLVLLVVLGIIPMCFTVAQDRNDANSYTVLVESAVPESLVPIEFTGAYASHDRATHPKLTFITQKTPFEMTVSGTNFVGLFQAKTENVMLKVTLKSLANGKMTSHAEGTGFLNLLHADPQGIGYGMPDGTVKLSSIQDILDLQREIN